MNMELASLLTNPKIMRIDGMPKGGATLTRANFEDVMGSISSCYGAACLLHFACWFDTHAGFKSRESCAKEVYRVIKDKTQPESYIELEIMAYLYRNTSLEDLGVPEERYNDFVDVCFGS